MNKQSLIIMAGLLFSSMMPLNASEPQLPTPHATTTRDIGPYVDLHEFMKTGILNLNGMKGSIVNMKNNQKDFLVRLLNSTTDGFAYLYDDSKRTPPLKVGDIISFDQLKRVPGNPMGGVTIQGEITVLSSQPQ